MYILKHFIKIHKRVQQLLTFKRKSIKKTLGHLNFYLHFFYLLNTTILNSCMIKLRITYDNELHFNILI